MLTQWNFNRMANIFNSFTEAHETQHTDVANRVSTTP